MSCPTDNEPSELRSSSPRMSFRSQRGEQSMAAIAEESIARDLEGETAVDDQDDNDAVPAVSQHSLAGSHRRPPSFVATGTPFVGIQQPESIMSAEQEREAALRDERSLLRDNNLIPSKRARRSSQASRASGTTNVANGDVSEPTETTALLENNALNDPESLIGGGDSPSAGDIDAKWEDAVRNGQIQTSWRREGKVISRYAAPLTLTFLLQNSLTLCSTFTVGHIGKNELGAVALGAMTASITGYSIFHGLATSLDTLCAQAYGSGKKHLVGLQMQRMVFFLWTICIPIGCVWLLATKLLKFIVPDHEIAELAGMYLKILIIGAPGYACFESGKRFVQAQGRFSATLYVLLIAAPLNIFLQWLLVWHFKWGFIGCPIAIAFVQNLMPFLLFCYVRFVGGMECWPGFTRKALTNWGPMVRLALPGLVMVMAEFFAFEILTLASARISSTHLAAQTILMNLCVCAYMLPFPLSIAASTRVANLIGAGLPEAAKTTARVTFVCGTVLGIFNMTVLSSLRMYIPRLFTNDEDVIAVASMILPINAAFQLFDALAAQCNGVLRGLGKQEVGGYISLFAFYIIAIPISLGTAFGLGWDLFGLWAGPAIGLMIQSTLEGIYIVKLSWSRAAEEAAKRNAAG